MLACVMIFNPKIIAKFKITKIIIKGERGRLHIAYHCQGKQNFHFFPKQSFQCLSDFRILSRFFRTLEALKIFFYFRSLFGVYQTSEAFFRFYFGFWMPFWFFFSDFKSLRFFFGFQQPFQGFTDFKSFLNLKMLSKSEKNLHFSYKNIYSKHFETE